MDKIRLGFVPSHREPFDESWAVEMRKRCLKALAGIDHLEIIVPGEKLTLNGLVRDDADAQKTARLFREKEVSGVIIGTMTFGDEVSALSLASSFRHLPLMIFGTKEGPFKDDGGRRSDSFCGTLSLSSGLYRRKITPIFAGILFPEDNLFRQGVENFIRVCTIVSGFIGAGIGLVGPRPERFETCICNEDAMIQKFNQRIVPTSLLDIMQRSEGLKASAPPLREIVRDMKKEADLSGSGEKAVRNMAALQYGLRQFALEKGLSALAVQCWTAMQQVYGMSACYSLGRLTDSGLLTACEVDVYGALSMLMQGLASLKSGRPHFIDWTIRHQQKENTFLSWHCGNAPPSLACRGCAIKVKSHSILGPQVGEDNARGTAEFQLKPGVVTLSRLTERDGQFKMLITRGKITTAKQDLAGSWSWVEVEDLDSLYRTLVMEGFTHHASQIHGDYVQPVKDACDFLKIETVIV